MLVFRVLSEVWVINYRHQFRYLWNPSIFMQLIQWDDWQQALLLQLLSIYIYVCQHLNFKFTHSIESDFQILSITLHSHYVEEASNSVLLTCTNFKNIDSKYCSSVQPQRPPQHICVCCGGSCVPLCAPSLTLWQSTMGFTPPIIISLLFTLSFCPSFLICTCICFPKHMKDRRPFLTGLNHSPITAGFKEAVYSCFAVIDCFCFNLQ